LSSSIPKELLPQLETEEDLEQILADAGEGDTTDGTTDDDESAISTQNFKNWRSGLSELQVQRWLQNFKMQVQKKISCVFHVVMVL
jgi:hypothetical protein